MSDALIVGCPSCNGLNRVPAGRLGDAPDCGRCDKPLFAGKPVALNEAGFRAQVEKSALPVVVDFWAPWCGPCRMMAPHFEAAAKQLEPHVRLAKVDTEAEPELGARFGIRSIPTMVLFRDGREVARQSGAMSSGDIVRWVRQNVG